MVHQDFIARIRFSNALPPPPNPPKLLDIPNMGLASGQYTTPGFASRLAREQPLNIEADAELGMPLDLVGMPGVFDGDERCELARMARMWPSVECSSFARKSTNACNSYPGSRTSSRRPPSRQGAFETYRGSRQAQGGRSKRILPPANRIHLVIDAKETRGGQPASPARQGTEASTTCPRSCSRLAPSHQTQDRPWL